MAIVTHFDKEYSCTTAIKGGDYVHLLNDDGKMIVAFDGVTDFSSFSIRDGSWKTPTPENECFLAVVKDDGMMGKGGHRCSDVRTGTVAVANGGTGATNAAIARANLGAAAGAEVSYTLSTAGWYRIASSAVGIGSNIGEFTIAGGGSGTHTLVSFKASICSGKYPQIVQLTNTTYSGANQYTKARIVYHTTYIGNYAYLEIYKNGTATSSTKFMFSGFGWTLHAPTAGAIPEGYTTKEMEFMPQNGIPTAGNVTGTVAIANGGTGARDAATARTNLGITPANIGAAPQGHTHADLVNGTTSFEVSISSNAALLTGKINNVNQWGIQRSNDTDYSLSAHYYNSATGNWERGYVLLDTNNFTNAVTPASIGALPANNIVCSATEPAGTAGKIWFKPVQ